MLAYIGHIETVIQIDIIDVEINESPAAGANALNKNS